MAPYTGIPLSPAELQYLHTSLSQNPPIRPDGRSPTQFRPLVAETDILSSTNGSARICFPDGTEAMVGVKAEVEKTWGGGQDVDGERTGQAVEDEEMRNAEVGAAKSGRGWGEWVEIGIELPGMRDDDALPIFLSAMLTEALLADTGLKDTLWINTRFHWRLYIDILLLSQPLSYPLPLLSLTTHLALLSTRLPSLISERDEDPLFNDDWEASTHLFPRSKADGGSAQKPPITLLVMSVGEMIFFDASADELAVADAVVALSVTQPLQPTSTSATEAEILPLKLVALRTIDPPSRLTAGGVPNALNSTSTTGTASTGNTSTGGILAIREKDQGQSVWRPPRGGVKRAVVGRMIKAVVEKGGVGMEVMAGLAGVET
ncbi:Exosome complex component rrp42 [Friedmanniomyces endolithicus]|uniref:Ribosomal RNA-processing protein 42 n=1 Tax=Friedmanniomyces endolithicus TaxID=329885 RepID=A0A4U0UA79_9PEZI|nr:Exosome complex component rrp42 [Friedmanniomyces endolithicus]KAK0267652.1 Exosome complex component rrp42 [Friedmanniomyces endolithicus]KAK0278938.1 Exosome complex component rrp42 [Friedmanniomyces endolithicus]KAK0303577.1 Exosome complex component rrp42 [Friedmanniomyces endolithicus]KAK0823636.1 Exosome complex component rrp42 [Friedmanniomyces endolithicus]